MSDKIKFTALGGATEIGANSFMLEFGNKLFIIDSGSSFETGWKCVPEWTDIPRDPDAIFITHGHNDHIGTLLPLMMRYPQTKVYMTEGTFEIAKVMLDDQVKISTFTKDKLPYAYILDYYLRNKEIFFSRMNTYPYLQEFRLRENDNFYFKFHDAGHILGSSMIEFSDGEHTVLHTGDYNTISTFSETGVSLVSLPKKVDVLISEATYGATHKEQNGREIALNNLADGINYAYNNGGSVLIPTFALGRTQEIMLAINFLKRENRIPKDIEVVSKGLSNSISEIYNKYYGFNLKYNWKSRLTPNVKKTTIFLLASGFLKNETPSQRFMEQIKDKENFSIIFPSSYSKIKTQEKLKNTKAAIYLADFSAHATKEEIVNFVHNISPKTLIFIHGNQNAVKDLNNACRNICHVYSPSENGETIYLQKNRKGNMVLKSSSNTRALVITVGTSLQTNHKRNTTSDLEEDLRKGIIDVNTYLTQKNKRTLCNSVEELYSFLQKNPKLSCAELNTLLSSEINETDYDRVFLISTEGAKTVSAVLEQYFESIHKEAETIIVEDLDAKEPDKFYSYGLRNLVFSITNIISRFKDSIFVVSGGYKAEIAYTNLAASIFRKRAFYMHETSNITKDMPLLPIGLDFKMYEIFHNDLDLIVNGSNMDISTQTYNSLPEYFREALIQEDTKSNRYVYSPLGMMLNMAYRSHVRAQDKRIDGKPLQSLLKDNESLHDIVNNIIDSDLRQRLNAVLSLDFVSKISFSNPFELSDEPQDTIKEKDSIKDLIMDYAEIYADTDYMQFVSSKRGNITYMLSGEEESVRKYQTMEIKVVGGMENSIMEIIGQHLTLNTNKEDQQD